MAAQNLQYFLLKIAQAGCCVPPSCLGVARGDRTPQKACMLCPTRCSVVIIVDVGVCETVFGCLTDHALLEELRLIVFFVICLLLFD